MTDSLATKEDLRELDTRLQARFSSIDARFASVDGRFASVDARFEELEKRLALRLDEQERRLELRLSGMTSLFKRGMADLERRVTVRMLAGIAAASALSKLL